MRDSDSLTDSDTELVFREVTPDDFSLIWLLLRQSVRDGECFPYPQHATEREVQALWFAPEARVFNAYRGEVLVASRYIVPNKPGLGSHVCNMGVIVAQDARGCGVGDAMMRFGIAKARELGYRAIQLNLVVARNTSSIALCERYGFAKVGVLPNAFHFAGREYVDALVLFKPLVTERDAVTTQ